MKWVETLHFSQDIVFKINKVNLKKHVYINVLFLLSEKGSKLPIDDYSLTIIKIQ